MSERVQFHPTQESQAYIVRIWRSHAEEQWCFSVQDVATGERLGFASLENLFAFFRGQIGDAADPQGEMPIS